MKKLLLGMLLFSQGAMANSVELITGGIDYHFFPQAPGVLNSLGTSNFSVNPQFGLSYVMNESRTYTTISLFGGSNEIYDPTFGGTVSYGLHNKTVYFGGVVGGYMQNNADLRAAGLTPVTLSSPNAAMGFTPIVGAELNFRLYLGEKSYIKFNNMVTPGYTNHTIGIGFDLQQ